MKQFTGHAGEKWGAFVDVKFPRRPMNLKKLAGGSVSIGTVTDPYNVLEAQYPVTQSALTELQGVDAQVTLITKSDLVVRDIELLAGLKDATVAFSIVNTDEKFRQIMEPGAPSFERRIEAMRQLYEKGIKTALFMSPIFPVITDFKKIISSTRHFVTQYWFENLNLRANYKKRVLHLIGQHYPEFQALYRKIFVEKKHPFWRDLKLEISGYCQALGLDYINYFYNEGDLRL
jgi:DNA repair photolyase